MRSPLNEWQIVFGLLGVSAILALAGPKIAAAALLVGACAVVPFVRRLPICGVNRLALSVTNALCAFVVWYTALKPSDAVNPILVLLDLEDLQIVWWSLITCLIVVTGAMWLSSRRAKNP